MLIEWNEEYLKEVMTTYSSSVSATGEDSNIITHELIQSQTLVNDTLELEKKVNELYQQSLNLATYKLVQII